MSLMPNIQMNMTMPTIMLAPMSVLLPFMRLIMSVIIAASSMTTAKTNIAFIKPEPKRSDCVT